MTTIGELIPSRMALMMQALFFKLCAKEINLPIITASQYPETPHNPCIKTDSMLAYDLLRQSMPTCHAVMYTLAPLKPTDEPVTMTMKLVKSRPRKPETTLQYYPTGFLGLDTSNLKDDTF